MICDIMTFQNIIHSESAKYLSNIFQYKYSNIKYIINIFQHNDISKYDSFRKCIIYDFSNSQK